MLSPLALTVLVSTPPAATHEVKLLPYLLGTAPRNEKWLKLRSANDRKKFRQATCTWVAKKNVLTISDRSSFFFLKWTIQSSINKEQAKKESPNFFWSFWRVSNLKHPTWTTVNIHGTFFFQPNHQSARQFWPGRFLEQLGTADLYLSEYREFLSTIREGFSSLSGWRGSFTSNQSCWNTNVGHVFFKFCRFVDSSKTCDILIHFP